MNPRPLIAKSRLFTKAPILPAIALLTAMNAADADTFLYNPPLNSDNTSNWSVSPYWTSGGSPAAPVSGASTRLTFISPNSSTFTQGVNIVSNNDSTDPFLLNILDLQGTKQASGLSNFTISGGTLRFVNNGATGPTININAVSGTSLTNYVNYNVSSNIDVANNLTVTGNGDQATFSGAFSGSGNITKTGNSRLILTGINNGYTGNVLVSQGTVSFNGVNNTQSAWVTTGSLTINAGASATMGAVNNTGGNAAFSALYGAGSLTGAGSGRRFAINYNGADADVFSGTVGAGAALELYGSGTLRLTNAITSQALTSVHWGTLETPGLSGLGRIGVFQGNFKVTGGTSLSIGGDSGDISALGGGTLWLTPTGSGGDIVYTAAENATVSNRFRMGIGSRIIIDKGNHNSLTLQIGSSSNTNTGIAGLGSGGVIIAPASGLAALGVSEKMIYVNSTGTAAPTVTNGAVDLRYVGQDNDANLSGDFLTYSGTGTTSDAGFQRFNWANGDTNFVAPSATKLERVTSGSSVNVSSSTTVWGLRNDGTVNIASGQTLSIGTSGVVGGLILNGGSISGGSVSFLGNTAQIYTSLANGTISSNLVAGTEVGVMGPGVLTYTGTNRWSGITRIFSGSTLDVNLGSLSTNTLYLSGGVLQSRGTFNRTLGESAANTVSFLREGANQSGGFAARGGSLTVSLQVGAVANADLVWGNGDAGISTAKFLNEAAVFHFGSATADSEVIFTNNLDLGGNTLYYNKVINVYDNVNSTTDRVRFTGNITSISSINGIVKDGAGILVLDGTNTYRGSTYVNAGTLVINGSIATSSGVTVAENAVLSGSGRVSSISGAGTVGPGNSAGILSATNVSFSGGLDAVFEMSLIGEANWASATNSGNDVLRLMGATPILNSADTDNVFSFYFAGQGTYVGGIFSDTNANFDSLISGATYQYYILDATGSVVYNGQNYRLLSDLFVSRSTVQITSADFAGGSVSDGWAQQFTVIPEPSTRLLFGLGMSGLIFLRRRPVRS